MGTPQILKRMMRASAIQWAVAALGGGYMTFVRYTARVDRPQPPAGGPFVIAMWHGRLMFIDYLRPGTRSVVTLISGNRDGRLISKLAWLGSRGAIRSVAGSSSQGGKRAVRQLIRSARAGANLFITPDGPRGPNMRAQRGVVELARLAGLPILPASVSASRAMEGRSWDRFLTPRPFTRVAVRWGEPIYVAHGDDLDAAIVKVETALTAAQQAADAACGRRSIQPQAQRHDGAFAPAKSKSVGSA